MQPDPASTIQASRPVPAVLPLNALWQSVGNIEGWAYLLSDPYADDYIFFIWRDGPGYTVTLVYPPLERDPLATGLRVQPDGRLMPLSPGQPTTFLAAFQMSVAWMAFHAINKRMPVLDPA